MAIFGGHSVAETRDLLNRTTYQANVIQTAWESFAPSWTNTGWRDAWIADWVAWRQRFDAGNFRAKLMALQAIKGSLPSSLIDAEDVYRDLLRVITKSGAGDYVTGDLPDLRQRLDEALMSYGRAPMDFSHAPPPDTSWDLDLIGYKYADGKIKGLEAAANAVINTARDAVTSPTAGWVMGVVLLGGLLYAGIIFGPALLPRMKS